VILPHEIMELQDYGVAKIFSPDDGREMGLQGMINLILEMSDFPVGNVTSADLKKIPLKDRKILGKMISAAENFS